MAVAMSATADGFSTLPEAALPGAGNLLARGERRALGLRLTLAMITAGLLLLSFAITLFAPDQADLAQLVAGVAALLVAIPAFAAAWHSLLHPDLHGLTDQLVALAVLAAWAGGDLMTAALLPLVMTIGHVLEERSLLGSQEAIGALRRLTRTTARRQGPDGSFAEIQAADLHPGDVVELRAGDRVPADGVVLAGQSSLDTAPITGESVPREAGPGSEIFDGAINVNGVLLIEITRVGAASTLGRVIALMQSAERAKPPITRLLERYAGSYRTFILLAAAAAWLATGSITALLAVLVAACPCALVLAAPATSIAAIAVAARHGILVKGAAFLEELAQVDCVVLDKTGTVTLGALRLAGIAAEPGVAESEMLAVAATLGAGSSHPVSRALAGLSTERIGLGQSDERQGLGVVAASDRGELALGRPELFERLGVAASAPPAHDGPIAGVSQAGRFLGWVKLADEARPEAAAAVAALRALGLGHQILLTGDRDSVAQSIAAQIGVTEVESEVLPDGKLACVLRQIRAGYRPMVVGDGINDSLALKAGAVGVAMGGQGTDVALAAADLVLMTNDLNRLATCVRLARRCRRTIHTNVGVGLGWTVALIAIAATGRLGAQGALLAALLHNLGTFAVMANAGRLLKFQDV